MVLTYDAYSETIEEKQQKDNEIDALKKQILSFEQAQKETQKQLEELLRYQSKTMNMSMKTI